MVTTYMRARSTLNVEDDKSANVTQAIVVTKTKAMNKL